MKYLVNGFHSQGYFPPLTAYRPLRVMLCMGSWKTKKVYLRIYSLLTLSWGC